MSEENRQLVLQLIDALNKRDADAFVAVLSPDVEWEDPMFWSEGAQTYRGRAEVRTWLSRLLEPWESFHTQAQEIIATDDDRVFVELSLSGRGKASATKTKARVWVVAWVANGLCTKRSVFRDRAEALEAAGLEE
jgi:ketosteroid isomerase-like protein